MAGLPKADWLVAGLGNPGPEYAGTRHNVGFAVVEGLAGAARAAFSSGPRRSRVALARLGGASVLLVEPLAFMNLSGEPVGACLAALGLPPDRLLVVHDDLDLPLGRLKVVAEAGAAGHRGVASIQEAIGTAAFPRVRVGIGRPGEAQDAAEHVLSAFTEAEGPLVAEAVARAADAVRSVILQGPAAAMNRFNTRAARSLDRSGESPERR
ncbi:MAG: aminoacyl-tRNA hydrolase [Candidatus Methylomirabilales bacterium]